MDTATDADVGRGPRTGRGDVRRDELAESALTTLAEFGYARTSLREIAANSAFTHGVVHYYFRDKTELIAYCVRYYKARCVTRYDEIVDSAGDAAALLDGFADKLAETLVSEAPYHRLWYDLRAQSLFDPTLFDPVLRDAVHGIDTALSDMIGRILGRYAVLVGRALAVDAETAYALLDGLFERALIDHLRGDAAAAGPLVARVRALLPHLVTDPAG